MTEEFSVCITGSISFRVSCLCLWMYWAYRPDGCITTNLQQLYSVNSRNRRRYSKNSPQLHETFRRLSCKHATTTHTIFQVIMVYTPGKWSRLLRYLIWTGWTPHCARLAELTSYTDIAQHFTWNPSGSHVMPLHPWNKILFCVFSLCEVAGIMRNLCQSLLEQFSSSVMVKLL